jgi:hypothetical protein
VSDEDLHRAALIGHEALAGIAPFLETIEGFVAATRRNGFTEEQARAIVAYIFGWRLADGSKPEGTP